MTCMKSGHDGTHAGSAGVQHAKGAAKINNVANSSMRQGGSALLPPSTQDDDGRLKSMKKIRSGLAVRVFLNPNKTRGCSII